MSELYVPLIVESVSFDEYNSDWLLYNSNTFVNPLWVKSLESNDRLAIYLHLKKNSTTIAKIAGLIIKGNLLQGTQLYFYSSPILLDYSDELFQQCIASLKHFAIKKRFTRLSIRPWNQEPAIKSEVKGTISTATNEYVIDLTVADYDNMVSTRVKKNIKKAQKMGASLRQSVDRSDLELLISCLDTTLSRRVNKFGTIYSPYYVFGVDKEVITRLISSGAAYLLCANLDERTLSVLLMLTDGNRTYCLLKGSHPDAYKTGVSSFVDYATVHFLQQKGMIAFNLGPELNTSEGQGLNQYKEGIGAVPHKRYGLYTYYLVFPFNLLNIAMNFGRRLAKHAFMSKIVSFASRFFSGSQN